MMMMRGLMAMTSWLMASSRLKHFGTCRFCAVKRKLC